MEGIWFLQGTSSTRGPYNGELELRKAADGTYDVVRIATYINYFFDGLKVQEVWTGKAVATPDSLTISYELRQGDFITRLGKLKRDQSDFANSITVLSRYIGTPNGLSTSYSDKKVSSYKEWITTRRPLEAKPLWTNERQKISAQGPKVPSDVRNVIKDSKRRIGYDKDFLVRSYSNRPEFKAEHPYVIFDPTDFQFYKSNKDIIRVTNKILDDISITEAVVKRNAYSPSLDEKAKSYDNNARDFHINEVGMVSYATVDESGRFLGYAPDGDASLWTGMYLGSQAMRYLKTKNPVALENVKKTLRGLMTLMEITENSQEFARTLAVYDPSQMNDEWRRGSGKYSNLMWMAGGNDDLLKGITHGFLWAGLVLPQSEAELWEDLKRNSRKLVDLKIVGEKLTNKVTALGLAAWLTNDEELRTEYTKHYSILRTQPTGSRFDTNFYWSGTADWSGLNLGLVRDITDITLADLLGQTEIRDQLRERLLDAWVVYSPSQQHLQTLAAYGFAFKYGSRSENFRRDNNEAKFNRALKQAVWGLREIPYPRPNLDVRVDHSLKAEWCMSPIPRMFWKSVKSPQPPVSNFYQGLYKYPTFELSALESNFIWKNGGFAYEGDKRKGQVSSGVDYLYAYWLAKFVGAEGVN